jgi:hypothetical protein
VAFSRLLFTTYVPSAISVANCAPVIGKTKLYSMCMPYGDVCDAGANRITDNVAVGIGGEPQLVITKSSSSSTGYRKSMIVGTSIVGGGGGGGGGGTPYSPPAPVQEGKWREKTRNPAN